MGNIGEEIRFHDLRPGKDMAVPAGEPPFVIGEKIALPLVPERTGLRDQHQKGIHSPGIPGSPKRLEGIWPIPEGIAVEGKYRPLAKARASHGDSGY